MLSTCRAGLIALAAFAASLLLFSPAFARAMGLAPPVRDLSERYARANGHLMLGDAEKWHSMVPMSHDFVLFSPFGGKPSRFADYTPERIERMGRFFKNGRHQQEMVQAFAGDDMIVLATIERDTVEVGGLPSQKWALRVTSVFKREGTVWKLAHRHADPFVDDVSIEEAARIARGERLLPAK